MLRNRCRRRLLLLLITDSIYGIVVEDVDLKRLSVSFKRDTKLILPLRREYRSPARLGLGAFFDDPLINLCGSKIEHKEIFAVRTDEFSKNLVSIAWIPAHHVKQLHEEYLPSHLTRLTLATAVGAPLERVQIRFQARPDSELLSLPIDQKLNVVYIRQAPDAGSIESDLVIAEGDGRFTHVREELSSNHLKLIQTEGIIILNRFITYGDNSQNFFLRSICCTFGGHWCKAGHPSVPEIIAVHTVHPPVVSSHLTLVR